MKNPKSLYVSSASRLKGKQQVRNIFILLLVIVVILALLLVLYVLGTKREIDEAFPTGIASRSDNSHTIPETDPTAVGSEPFGTSDSSNATSDSASQTSDSSVEPIDSGSDNTDSTRNTNLPEPPPEETDIFFKYSGMLQTVTHKDRDIALAKLKQTVREYIQGASDARIGFYYVNLKNNEEFGWNDLSPFVVGGAINLPINLALYEEARTGILSFKEVMTYKEEDQTEGPGVIANRNYGAQYFIRSLSGLSLTSSDNIATAMLIRRLGGIERVCDRFGEISMIVDYDSVSNYTDYSKKQQSGKRRTSTQDMARYAEELYYLYLMYPDHYQPMINDLAANALISPIADVFPEGSSFFRKSGVNGIYKSTTELSLIFCEEPIILCINVECRSADRTAQIMDDLARLTADYITFCYT